MKSMSAIVLFLCAPLGLALGRFAVLLAPLALAAAMLAIPADEARAHDEHPGGSYNLYPAVHPGDLAALVHLLESSHGFDVNVKNLNGETPLYWAALYGRATIAATLIAAGANVNATTARAYTPLQRAAGSGHADVVAVLMSAGAEVNAKDVFGGTPLHWAAGSGRATIVATLIAAGAEVNAKTNTGRTPLHEAAFWRGRAAVAATVAATLIAAGAEVNAKDDDGRTPLRSTCGIYGCRSSHAPVRAVLIAAGGHWGEACAGLATINPTSYNPPCLSAQGCGRLNPPQFFDETRVSITAGECVPFRPCADGTLDRQTNTCECAGAAVLDGAGNNCECLAPNLHFAVGDCRAPSVEVCRQIASFHDATAGQCVSFKPCAGGTLDRQANTCECAAPAVLDGAGNNCECLLPNLGFAGDCRAPSAENCAEHYDPPRFFDPTRVSITAGECTDRLYPCHDSAVVKADNSGCECPVGAYAHGDPSGGEWNRYDASGYLWEAYCYYYPGQRQCATDEWRKSIPASAECHADHAPLSHDLDGWLDAIRANNPTLVAHFITDHGQDPDADYALHLAARHSALGIAKLLLQRGANPDAADSDGDTPLHEVARLDDAADNVALISLLLDKGANPNIGNNARWRPLDLAYGRTDSFPPRRKMMAALIAGGADWASECTGGKIPNEHYRPPEVSDCKCPNHLAVDNNGVCECPAHSHAQVNGRCLPKDSAQVADEIEKMRAELERLRAELAELNRRLTLLADAPEMPPEMLEEVAKQAEVAARGIARRRDNFLALARAGLAEADDAGAAPMLALSDTEATCRMLEGEVQTHSRTGSKICSGIDHNDTFCIVGSASAFPCVGLFRHVRRCNDDHNRPALDPWHCAAPCPSGLRARGAKCAAD